MTIKVAIAAQYASGICMSLAMMTDTVTATAVRMACVIEGRFFLSPTQNFISQSSSPPAPIGKITIDGMEHGLQLEFCKQTSTPKALTHALPLISTSRFAHLCRSRPRGSVREQALKV